MLHILMGRARTGKSARILRSIAALGDASQQILLVPEHASHVAEVDLCRACGDTASRHAEVLTFKLLSSRVLSVCGGAAEVTLDNGGKLLTLQRTLTELAPMLKVYRRASQRQAFLESLLALMEELQAYAVTPERLSEAVGTLGGENGDKLRDLALIYGIYLAKLCTGERDVRDRLQKLEENLEKSHYIDGKDVFLDGFAYFTAREKNILRAMLRHARSVTVTLLGDKNDTELFTESLRERDALIAMARETGTECEVEYLAAGHAGDALEHIEQSFFGSGEAWTKETDAVMLYEASTAYAECEWAASQIRKLLRKDGLRLRDITLTARNIDAYSGTLETVLRHYGIPFYCARRSDILAQPVLSLILGALDSVCGGFEYEDMFRCLKTGLCGLSSEECDRLENYVLKWDLRGAQWTRETPWTAHPDGYGVDWDDASRERLADINALRERVRVPLSRLSGGLRAAESAKEKITALYAFLEEIGLPEQLQAQTQTLFAAGKLQRAEETGQLWSILCGVMDQFVEILGDCALDAEEFAKLLRLVLTQYSVGTIPVTLDAVNICEMTRNDRHTVKALFLLGANDGVLPAVERDGGVLREEDRVTLEQRDITLSPHGMAQFRLEMQNLYAALAQPTQRLFVSYPIRDVSGAELRPSFVVGRLKKLFPAKSVEKESAGREYRLSSRESAFACAGEHIGGRLWQYFAAQEENRVRLAAMERASRYTRGRLSDGAVRSLYGSAMTLSASRMDKARACHFAYFMQYGLRARERTAAGFDAPQVGTFVHDVMEHTLRAAGEMGGIGTLDGKQLHALVRQAMEDYIARNLPDLSEKTARFRYLFKRLCESTVRILDEVAEELRHSDFVPMKFELGFGGDGELPAISISDGGCETRVIGKVDRVDGWLHDGRLYLRVVDYKTGRRSFDLSELRYGMGLQMLLYLFALREKGEVLFGHEIVPAGVLYTPAREPMLSCPRSITQEKLEREMKRNLRRSGLVLAEPEVLRAMEYDALESPSYLPLKIKADGTITEGVASAEQLGKLGKYVEHLLREISREVMSGNIDADPFARSPQETACTYCPFASACHFEDGSGGDHLEYIRSTPAEEFWRHVDDMVEGKEAAPCRRN